MSEGRKTRRAGPKDEKAKLDRDWQKISQVGTCISLIEKCNFSEVGVLSAYVILWVHFSQECFFLWFVTDMFDDSALSIYSFDWEKSIDRYFLN